MRVVLSKMLEKALNRAKYFEDVLSDYQELVDELNEKVVLQKEEIRRLNAELKQLKKKISKKESKND